MFPLVEQHLPEIASLCQTFRVTRLELFGSAARGDFRPESSDLDFFVEFEDLGWQGSSTRYFGLLFGLEDLLGRKIDLVDRSAVTNPYFLPVANRHLELVYASRIAKTA